MNGKIFISYSWAEPYGSIVNNWLVPAIKAADIKCLVDKEACGYNGNIDKFETDIPNAAKVILVLSPEFLQSPECMFEAALAVSKCDVEKQVYVINLLNYNFRKDEQNLLEKASSHFNGLKMQKQDALSKLPDSARGPLKDDLRRINTVIDNLNSLWRMFKSKNSGAFGDISKDGFMLVCRELKKSLDDLPNELER